MWVVDRVHGHATNGRALALPSHAAGLTPVDVRLLGIADLANRCTRTQVNVANLSRRHTQLRIGAVLRDQLHAGAGRSSNLGSPTRLDLHRVDNGSHRNVAQRQVVAGLDVSTGTSLDAVALLQLLRSDDVALLTVGEVQQSDASGAVGVVLNVSDLGGHAVLIRPLEINESVGALVTTALMSGRDLS